MSPIVSALANKDIHMEPKQGIITREVACSGITLKLADYVWILGMAENGRIPVEYKNHMTTVPENHVIQCPVPRADLDDLRKKDDCFGRPGDYFTEEFNSERYWFRLLRCKRHGRLFLEDTRGGIAMYTRMILVTSTDEDPETIWNQYHSMSDDWLNHLGIAY